MFSVDAFHKFTPSFWSAFYQRPVRLLLTGLISLLLCWPAIAQNITSGVDEQVKKIASDIPPALQPWQAWVLAKHPNRHCPWLADGNEQQCLWVSQSTFVAANTGAEFSVDVQLYQEGWVTLPGDVRYWPQQVMVRGAQAPVSQPALRDQNGEPQIWLQRGNWQISGHFRWSQAPQSIQIPEQSGIVALEWQQQKVSQPKRLGRQLWLQPAGQQTADVAQDQLQIQVFRLLEDQIPARMTTLLQLDVSGNSREIELKGALLPAFQALALESDLPALLNANGVLRIQLQPGRWQVELISQSSELPQSLTFPAATAPWPDTEILAFAAAPELRTIQMNGAPALDPNQTQAPAHWQQYPLYQVNAASTLQLNQQSRGASLSQDQLHLHKMAWLDFSGQHLTVSDTITGQLSSSSRLQVMQPYQLGRAELAGEPQLITQLPAQQPGVELRQNPLQLNTVSTVALPSSLPASLPISGWQARFSGVEMQLQLPPGWSLFTASGVDDIQGGYIQRWSLWDIFFVLLLTTACGRMFGWKLAVLSLVCMLLLYQRAEAPQWLWLILVTLLASLKIASGRALLWLQRGSQLCAVLLFLLLLPFAVDQIRLAIYPQLEKPWHSIQYQNDAKHESANRAAFERRERQAEERQTQVMMSDAEVPAAADSLSIAGASGSAALTEAKRYRQTISESLISASTVDLAQDPTARIQTGPARPDWQWQSVYLRWQGPVLPEEQTQLYLVPAWLNRLGAVVTVLLAFAFWWLLSRSLWQFERLSFRKAPALMSLLPALVFLSSLLTPPPAFSQSVPDADLLAELEQRLLKRPECLPDCNSMSQLQVKASETQVELTIELHSLEPSAWPLPVALNMVQKISLDQQPAALYSHQDQHWLLLPKGQHQLVLSLNVSNIQQLTLQFAQPWHQLTTELRGWDLKLDTTTDDDLSGLLQSRKQLQIQRTSSAQTQQRLDPTQSAIQPAATLTRQLQLGLEWQLHSTLQRHGQSNASLQFSFPLLNGETPLSKLAVIDGNIQVQLAPDQQSVSWVSRLTKAEALQLTAQNHPLLHEVWQLAAGPQWHVNSSGIPAIADATSPLPQLWRPWPGEQLQLQISQPPAVVGDTLTIHRARLTQQQGKRSADVELVLDMTASIAQTYQLQLPADAEIMQVKADDRVLPAQSSQLLQLPLRPGTQQLTINWKQRSDSFWQYQTPTLDLGQAAGNIYLQLQLPADRWLWAVTGPAIGPAILFWGMLLVLLALAVVLARVIPSPLTTGHWLLLFAGISTVSLWIPVVIALWLFSLSKRGQLQQPLVGVKGRLQQLGLLLLSFSAVAALLLAIPYGLLAQPDMHLVGNGSYLQNLQWYQDVVTGELPVATSWSLPLWCYQLAMLLWSLWLATALVRWLPWAWRQLSYLGFWPAPANDAAMTDSDSVDKTDPAMTDEAQNVEVSHVEASHDEASHVEVMANDKSTTVPTTEIGSEEGKTGDSAKTPDNLDK